jgi:adenosylhomocysteine nucleosidase
MRILMVAADPMEFTGILAHTAGARPVSVRLGWARQAQLAEHEMLLVANGAGARRAAAAVDTALASFTPGAIVSTGFCGALAPELSVADIVAGTNVTDGARSFTSLQPQSPLPHHKGVIVSIDHVAQYAAEKRNLRERGGLAVEMEAGGVAARAEAHRIPFYCVRVVTDLAGEDMANDFNEALREDGHFATMVILKGTLRKPWVRLPELFRLRNRCARAARVLGEFIADCRF